MELKEEKLCYSCTGNVQGLCISPVSGKVHEIKLKDNKCPQYEKEENKQFKCPECGKDSLRDSTKNRSIRTGVVLCNYCFYGRPITMMKKYDFERYLEIKGKPLPIQKI